MHRPLRSHQRLVAGIVAAIASGQTDLADILAAVTPGGGKSLLHRDTYSCLAGNTAARHPFDAG